MAIAATAARMLVDGTAGDFEGAKRKAARGLGLVGSRNLPDNLEVHNAVADYLALFHRAAHETRLRRLREAAVRGMELFERFDPRLAGPVLYGTACEHSSINLHLFTAELEAVTRFLLEHRLVYELGESRFRFGRSDATQAIPVFKLAVLGENFELAVFPLEGAARHPMSPIDGKPMRRAGVKAVNRLLGSGQTFSSDRSFASIVDLS